ncbi:MAG: TlpA family protein disulfide reductase, partial [Acidimicrobiaceae bacterium]|nr:TlpA family protein disulfide reductase [Acidimicrobiaceae bacterium]
GSAPSAAAAPAVSGPTAGGGHYSLGAERGHWVLVNFFASWCTDCKAELAQLAALQHRQPAGLRVVSVDGLDDSFAKAERLIRGSGGSWPLVNDPAALEAYRVNSLPQSFLVSPEGRIADHVFGGVKATTLTATLGARS